MNACRTVHSLYVSLQMHSDLFLSRQRKPRNRQLRKPLVVQVWEQRKGIITGLFLENLHSTQLDWERVKYWFLTLRVKCARVSVTSVLSTANTPTPNHRRYSSARLLLLYPLQLICHRWTLSQTTETAEMLLLFWNEIVCMIIAFLTLNLILALYYFFPLHRNWLLPANTDSPGSFVPPPSVQGFPCSIQQLCNSYSALQYVLLLVTNLFLFFPPWLLYYPFCAVIKGLHRYSLFYTFIFFPCCFRSLLTKLLNISLEHFVSLCSCRCLSDVTNPLCSPSVNTLSGAIDLAAKSAGIIPGSPCRELTSSSVDNKMLIPSTPVTEDEPDADLLQHNVPEVSSTCVFAIIVAMRLCLSCEGHLLTRLLKRRPLRKSVSSCVKLVPFTEWRASSISRDDWWRGLSPLTSQCSHASGHFSSWPTWRSPGPWWTSDTHQWLHHWARH